MISASWKGALAISFSAVLWGLDGVVLTPKLHTLDVFFVVLMLHAIPFAVMSIFLPKKFKAILKFSPVELTALFLASLLGGAAGTIFIVKALFIIDFQPFTIVILLQKLQPVFAITLAAMLLKEKPGSKFLLWAGLAIAAGYFLT
ncbi:MAG TPA: EamA family transporter, partial [Aliarcobacter cryaerophilus]|nr:EamA family transporter [Aliarcobacter cryaerophilus]